MLLTRVAQLLLHLDQSLNADFRGAFGELELKEIVGMSEAVRQVVFHVQCKICSFSRPPKAYHRSKRYATEKQEKDSTEQARSNESRLPEMTAGWCFDSHL